MQEEIEGAIHTLNLFMSLKITRLQIALDLNYFEMSFVRQNILIPIPNMPTTDSWAQSVLGIVMHTLNLLPC